MIMTTNQKKKMNINENRFPFKLKIDDAKQIIDVACYNWKSKLANKWGASIVLTDEIIIDEVLYNSMRNASTIKQHAILDKIFGYDFDLSHVKSFEDALAIKGESIKSFATRTQYHKPHMVAQEMLEIIISVLNDKWVVNANDDNQDKWYPSFYLPCNNINGEFSLLSCGLRKTYTDVNLLLSTKNQAICRYVATQFIHLYKDMLNVN